MKKVAALIIGGDFIQDANRINDVLEIKGAKQNQLIAK
jgi:hypothetical protein